MNKELLLQDALLLEDVLRLEHPTDPVQRANLAAFLTVAIELGMVKTRLVSATIVGEEGYLPAEEWVDRADWRTWREHCPKELLSPLSVAPAWLSAAPEKPPGLSEKEIVDLRLGGWTNERITLEHGVPRDRIIKINKKKHIPRLTPGPKPKVD